MDNKNIEKFYIDKMTLSGKSQSLNDFKKPVEFAGGIKGQKVFGKILRKGKSKAKGRIIELIEKSPLETEKVCQNFGKCGGCLLLSVPYDEQIKLKEEMLREHFLSMGHREFADIKLLKSPANLEYKNKMEFTFGNKEKDGPMNLGLHQRGSFMNILSCADCKLVDDDYRKILEFTENYFKSENLTFYKAKAHTGYLRNLIIRKGFFTGEILVNLVTTSGNHGLEKYAGKLKELKLTGKITGIIHTENDNISDTVTPEKVKLIDGRDYFYDYILDKKFKISPFSFFQTNSQGANALFKEVLGMIKDGYDEIYDLYSGTGTIAITLSSKAKKITGIEIVQEAVLAAKENAKINNAANTEFICADVNEALPELNDNLPLIVLDPPRGGIPLKSLQKIISFNPEQILYISCNPKMLAKDLIMLKDNEYKVIKKSAVDMFPNTNHVECIALIQRVKS